MTCGLTGAAFPAGTRQLAAGTAVSVKRGGPAGRRKLAVAVIVLLAAKARSIRGVSPGPVWLAFVASAALLV